MIMNIFDKYFKKEMTLPNFSTVVSQLRHFLPTSRNDTSYLKEYKNWVFACVNARAEELANIKLELYSGDKLVTSHPIFDLINDVNPNTTKYELFFGTQAFLDLTGNAFWYLAREGEGKGKIKQIYLLSPEKMSIVAGQTGLSIAGYVYKNGKDEIPFNPTEILHFKNFNPNGNYPSPHKGMGIVESALWAIETDNESRNWNYSFFKNSAKPDGILSTEGTLSETQYTRIKQQWAQAQQGSGKNGNFALLEGGLKWQETSKTQKDMDFVAQRTFSRDEIFSLFRVPKSVIGIVEDVNRANAEASDYVFAKRTVDPIMKRFVTMLNEYLLPEYGSGLCFKYANPVPDDRLAELQEYSLGWNKWLTTNDIRLEEGLLPSANGDKLYGTFNEVERDNVARPKAIKNVESISKADQVINDFVAKLPVKKELRKATSAQKSVYKEIYLKRFDANEKKLMVELVKYFDKQEVEVLKNVNDEYAGLKPKEYKMKGVKDVLFNRDNAIRSGISLITPNIRRFLDEGIELADSVTGENSNNNTPELDAFISERAKYFAKTINETTAEKLVESITLLLEDGAGISDIKDRVKEIYESAKESRIEMIARTEVSASLNEGAIQGYKQAGIENLEWVTVGGGEAVICQENDGEVRKIGESFSSGETSPPNHPNCFLHHTIKIQTDNGIKTINKIKVGDNVLTHRGRYKKVTKVLEKTERYKGDAVQITYKGRSKKYRNSFTVTPEHPFLTVKGWVMAKDLTTFDDLYVLANRCSACNSKIPHWKTFCSASCVVTDEIKQKIGLKNMGENNGMYNRIGSSSPNYKGGKVSYRGSHWRVERRKALVRDNYTCQDCGISEDHNKDLYKGQGLQVHHISPYRETKCNEVDNLTSLCHKCHGVREGTLNKKVLMSGGAEFILMPIREVEHIKNYNGERLYNFAVEEDESYIANGVVTHNCKCSVVAVFND